MADNEKVGIPDAVRSARGCLRTRYREGAMDYIRSWARRRCRRSDMLLLEEQFINISILSRDELSDALSLGSVGEQRRQEQVLMEKAEVREEKRIQIDNLLAASKAKCHNKILVWGCAGSGKTTVFLGKIPLDWAKELIWKDIHLLFCPSIRRLERETYKYSSMELVKEMCPDLTEQERQDVVKYMRDYPSRVCVIIDGLDASKVERSGQSTFLQDLIQGNALCNTTKIVTSRPCEAARDWSSEGVFHLELTGFTSENIKSYIDKFLGSDAAAMKDELLSSQEMSTLMSLPLMLNLCCQQYVQQKRVPCCVTELFTNFIEMLCEEDRKQQLDVYHVVDKDPATCVNELGGLALHNIIARPGDELFYETDLKEVGVSEKAKAFCGLIYQHDEPSSPMSFSDGRLREFLAAGFASTIVADSPDDIQALVNLIGFADGQAHSFWRFLLAKLSADADAEVLLECLLRLLLGHGGKPIASPVGGGSFGGLIISESQLRMIKERLCSALDFETMKKFADELLLDVCRDSGRGHRRVENALPRGRVLTDDHYLETLLDIWKTTCTIATGRKFCAALRKVSPRLLEEADYLCQELGLQQLPVHSQSHDCSEEQFFQGVQLIYGCYAERCRLRPKSYLVSKTVTTLLTDHTPRYNSQCSIDVYGRHSVSDMHSLALVMTYHSGFVTQVRCRSRCSQVVLAFLTALKTCGSISSLSLDGYGIDSTHMEDLMCVLALNGLCLRTFSLRGSRMLGSLSFVFCGLKACSLLQVLHLRDLSLDKSHAESIATDVPVGLHELDLSLNPGLSDAGVCDILLALADRCHFLQRLDLESTALTRDTLTSFSVLVRQCWQLEYIYLRDNPGLRLGLDMEADVEVQGFVDAVIHSNVRKVILRDRPPSEEEGHDVLYAILNAYGR